nr:unnamed protein product [Callosobruchus chinensis]
MQGVINNNMSYKAAANKYVENSGHKTTCGPTPILSVKEEYELKDLHLVDSQGKKEDIMNSVQKCLTENPRPNPFINNRPGDCWLKLSAMPKLKEYDKSNLDGAVQDVINKVESYRSTIEFRIKHPGHKDTCGPSPVLSDEEEKILVK